jgi:acetyl esterase/lipase
MIPLPNGLSGSVIFHGMLAAGMLLGGLTSFPVGAADIPAHVETPRTKTPAARLSPIEETLNVRYFPGKDRQLLDVFRPREAKRAPVVLFVHGGTWMMGDKNFYGQYRTLGRFLAQKGFCAVLINYRLSPEVKHPEHVKDVARAFAWVRSQIDRYGGDPGRIILCGHSAGGHLVALLATDRKYLDDPALKLKPGARAAIRGVIGVCGVYQIPTPEEFKKMLAVIVASRMGPPEKRGLVTTLLTPALTRAGETLNPFRLVFGDGPDVRKEASPITHVRKNLPPFLVLTAEAEVPGLAGMADDFTQALRKEKNSVEQHCVEGANHRAILFHLDRPGDPTAKLLLDFLNKHTKK